MALKPTNDRQLPQQAINDFYNKQTYNGNSYVIASGAIDIATSGVETPILLLSNPASNFAPSGAQGIRNVGCFQGLRKLSQATNVASATTIFKFYCNPVAPSPGSTATALNLRPSYGNNSQMLSYISPTIVSNGTYLASFAINYQEIDSSLMFILDPGYALLVTANTDTNSTSVIAELSWYEL